mgnify:CR=1 FL=1
MNDKTAEVGGQKTFKITHTRDERTCERLCFAKDFKITHTRDEPGRIKRLDHYAL